MLQSDRMSPGSEKKGFFFFLGAGGGGGGVSGGDSETEEKVTAMSRVLAQAPR